MEVTTLQKNDEQAEEEQMKRRKNEVDGFGFLPDDILLDILKRLPDAFLRFKAKYVCKRWFMISTDKILLDHASFILQKSTVRLVDIGEAQDGLEVREQNLDIPLPHKIKSCCNEFLLISDLARRKSLYIFNLITKERLYLPKGETHCGGHYSGSCSLALSLDGSKGVYKVVHLFIGRTIQCHILISGRNIVSGSSSSKWKKIEVVSDIIKKWKCYQGDLVSVQVQGRYIHWDVHGYNCLISMDMVKEEIFQMSLPGSDCRLSSLYSILEMGGFLTLIDGGGTSLGKADVWILKDFDKKKWEKLQSITVLGGLYKRFLGTLNRVCGVISKRYIIFMKSLPNNGMFSYDMKTGVLKELNIQMESGQNQVVRSSTLRFFREDMISL